MSPQPRIKNGHIRHIDRRRGVAPVDAASLLLAVAMLRFVVVPCLNTRKTPARGVLFFSDPLSRMRPARTGSLVLALAAAACVGASSDPEDLRTRAERTAYTETSRYEDVVELMEVVAERSDLIHLTTFGYTTEGRALRLAVVGDVSDPSPEAVRASGKLPVYLQGNIHGGEVPGKEALLMLLRDVASGATGDWLDSLVLLVAPLYNADGNERVRLTNRPRQHGPTAGMGQRPNAQGLDLNRDHMKLASSEARSVARLLSEFDPYVTVDLHTTNGTRHGYHLTYSPPLHPGTHPALIDLLRGRLLPDITEQIRQKHGWEYYYYGNLSTPPGASEPAWTTFDHRPRFNNNYVGLRNRVAILSEAYSYATFEDRVLATAYFVDEILDWVSRESDAVRSAVAEADNTVGASLPTRAAPERSPQPVEILLGEVDEERNPFSGEVMLRRRDVRTPTTMYEYGTFASTESARAPAAYLLPAQWTNVAENLSAHGIQLRTLEAARDLGVEVFRVDSTRVAERAFEGRLERTVWGVYREEGRLVPAGTIVVPLDQTLGRLAFYLLEPRSDDGLLAWGALDDGIRAGEDYPILRAMEAVP